ncbi:MAG: sensor protein [Bacteroidota bacterium]|nr:sensor protein [Bacteroidota bacterium]
MTSVEVKYNKLLLKQIQKKFGNTDNLPPEVVELLNTVSQTYDYYERERQLLERSMDLSNDEMIEANRKLEQQSEKLKRSNDELKQFAFAVSHDLKEPLRTIASYVQLIELRLKGQFTSETKEFMDFAVSGVKRLQSMLEGMLKYAQVSEGRKDFESVDLNTILKTVVDNLHPIIIEAKVEIKIDEVPELISGNKAQLTLLFQNLVSNSIKFRAAKAPSIEIRLLKNQRDLLFSVSDNGIGVSGTQKQNLFSMFKRGHNDYEGVGMGLTICKKIIENHGGVIWLDETAQTGMTVFFTLPKA